jgi:outer membrane beta-barrel protein
MSRLRWLLVCAALLPSVALAASEDEAGDIAEVDKDAMGPLKDRIRPVSGHIFLKRRRFELSPELGISIKDAFYSKYVPGALLAYHFSDQLTLGARFSYGVSAVSGAAQICTDTGATRGCRSPTKEELDGRAPGQLKMMGGLEFQWAPIYGKISLLSEAFLHFDMYGILGPTYIQYAGPTATGVGSETVSTLGANVGVGFRFFCNRWLAVRTELRDLIYSEKIQGNSSMVRGQIMVNLGLSIFFPLNFSEN